MRRVGVAIGRAGLPLAFCALLSAQWANYPIPGVPKTPAGLPNLKAPPPRNTPGTADGKPDFSGIWEPEHNRPCPADGCPDAPVSQEFMNIGWSLKGGLPYQPWARDLVKERMSQDGKDDPASRCQPGGVMKMNTNPLFRKIVQTPGLMVILEERDAAYRQIFTDGRPLPVDPEPSFNGYSSGKWDGDTLVVQTTGFKDGLWLDRAGNPLTDSARMTERFRRIDYGHMEIEITVADLKAYTAPWTVKLHHNIVLNSDLIDLYCVENEKDVQRMVGK